MRLWKWKFVCTCTWQIIMRLVTKRRCPEICCASTAWSFKSSRNGYQGVRFTDTKELINHWCLACLPLISHLIFFTAPSFHYPLYTPPHSSLSLSPPCCLLFPPLSFPSSLSPSPFPHYCASSVCLYFLLIWFLLVCETDLNKID